MSNALKNSVHYAGQEELQVMTDRVDGFPDGITIADKRNWLEIFRRFDDNNDGLIPLNELRSKIDAAAENLELSDSDRRRLFEGADRNMDEQIDFGEFCFLMAKAKRMHLTNVMLNAARLVLPRSMREEPFNYLQQYSCWPPPIFIITVTICEVSCYAYYAATDPNGGISVSGPTPTYSPLIYNPYKRQEVWRFLTYMLIHIGIYHVLFNAIVQIMLGIPLELVHKYWRVGIVYLCGVVAGSLASSVADPLSFLAGASGGVYALLAAHGAHLVVNWAEMEFAVVRLIMLIVIIGADVSIAVYDRYSSHQSPHNISYSAHFGGLVAGLLTGILIFRNFKLKIWERVVWWIALFGLISLTLICILFNVFYPQYATGPVG